MVKSEYKYTAHLSNLPGTFHISLTGPELVGATQDSYKAYVLKIFAE